MRGCFFVLNVLMFKSSKIQGLITAVHQGVNAIIMRDSGSAVRFSGRYMRFSGPKMRDPVPNYEVFGARYVAPALSVNN